MSPEECVDHLVIGAGPAGPQLAHHLKRAGRGHLVVEAGRAGAPVPAVPE